MQSILLLITIILSISHSTQASVAFYDQPVTIGVVWDQTNWINIQSTIDLALDDFRSVFPVAVNVAYEDATWHSTGTIAAGMRMAKRHPIAVIGTGDALSSLSLVNLGGSQALNVPVLHTISGSTTLDIGSRVRLSNAFSGYSNVINNLLIKQNWSRVALIHSLDVEGRMTTDHMIQVPVPNAQYSIYTLGGNEALMRYTLENTLNEIAVSGFRVIVMHGVYTLDVLLAAGRRGMMDAPYSWIGTDWCRNETIIDQLKHDWLTGVTCVDAYGYETPEWTIFRQRVLDKATATNSLITPTIPFSNTFLYDAIGTIAYAMHNQQADAITRNTTKNVASLAKALIAVSFQGAVAPVHFALNSQARVVYASVINYHHQSGRFEQVGTYNESLGSSATMQLHRPLIYSNGNEHGQSDRAGMFYPMETLLRTRDTRMSIVSYVMSVLGFWTMLLLLEQGITRKKKQMIQRATAAVRQRTRWQVIRSYRWTLWVLLAAAVGGIAGVAQSIVIDLIGVSVPSTVLKIEAGSIIAFMFASAGIMLIGLLAPFLFLNPASSWSYSPSTQAKSSTGSANRGSMLTSVAAPSTKHASVSKQPTDSTNSSAARETSAYRWSMTAKQLFSWRLAVCSVMFTIATVLCHYRLFLLIQGPFVERGDTLWFAKSAAFLLLVGWIPWWMVYHYHRSSLRFVVAFLLAAVTWGGNQLMFLSHDWVYDDSFSYSATAFEWDEVSALIVAGSCVALCSVALVINVFALQVSQRVLGLHLTEIRDRIERVSRQVKEQEHTFNRLQGAVELHAKLILLTTYCRPCMRSYAEIWAVCCDDEQLALQCLRGNRLPSLLMPSAGWNGVPAKKVKINFNEAAKEALEQATRNSVVKPMTPSFRPTESSTVTQILNPSPNPSPTPGVMSPTGGLQTQNFVISPPSAQRPMKSPNTPVNCTREVPLRLADLLSHPFGCELLRDQLEKKHTPENLMFYCDVARYKKLQCDWTARRAANEIFNLYIKEGAPFQINIPHQLRAQLTTTSEAYQLEERDGQQTSTLCLPLDLFDAADMEIWNLIQTNEIYTLNKQCTSNQVRIIQEMVL